MNEKMEKSLAVLITHSARHCHRFRLANYNLAAVPHASLRALASSMLDDFERELERLLEKEGNKMGSDAPPEGTPGDETSLRGFKLRSFPTR